MLNALLTALVTAVLPALLKLALDWVGKQNAAQVNLNVAKKEADIAQAVTSAPSTINETLAALDKGAF